MLVGGNWPLIVTTNWDSMIEDAWDVACRANVRHGRRFEPHLPVRYRQDVHALFAEIQVRALWFLACTRAASSVASCDTNYKAYLPTPRLFKLHGDLSERGIREFVSSHADYRRLMVRSVASVYRHMLSVTSGGVLWCGGSCETLGALLSCGTSPPTFRSCSTGTPWRTKTYSQP